MKRQNTVSHKPQILAEIHNFADEQRLKTHIGMFWEKITTLFMAIALTLPAFAAPDKSRKRKAVETVVLTEPDKLSPKPLQAKLTAVPAEARLRSGKEWAGLTSEGIDVSHYQGDIDWAAVAATKLVSYVYIKSSEGESLVDDYYRVNLEGARKAGLKVGSYHYYRPDADADMQFQNLTSQVIRKEQDLAPIIDIEKRGTKSEEKFIADLRDFLLRVEKHYGCKPVIYTFHNFYNRYLSGQFKGYRMMIARYREDEPTLDDDAPYTAWQYTQRGKIDGIRGYVDRSMVMSDFSVSDLSIEE